jgi:hypothetical protein
VCPEAEPGLKGGPWKRVSDPAYQSVQEQERLSANFGVTLVVVSHGP